MNGGEWVVFLLLAGFGVVGGLHLAIWTLRGGPGRVLAAAAGLLPRVRQLALAGQAPPPPAAGVARPAGQRVARPSGRAFSPADRRRRDFLIQAGLDAKMTPAQLARLWHYRPRTVGDRATAISARRRESRLVAARLEAVGDGR